ncbi:hypothetical protein CMI47_15635 [Candidatus Pacearchaeota archaeon]|jgi:glycosyltransferase involved in cell wall biosynthesis|nr:hypothetical protein [Candidatus Pacearchaeota archaeon]|tara:strand:+ start:13612 stop:14526 length:915 start_codon:yes stop_codon:yes gene_type:complete
MRVFIEKSGLSGGPRAFKDRIIDQFNISDEVKVVHNGEFDVELAFIRSAKKHNKPVVLRLDGCYYEKGRLGGNKAIKKSIKKADRIIFQSNFSKKMIHKLLKISNDKMLNSSVIYNGIDLDHIESIKPKYKKIPMSFVCAASWRKNKRPMSIVKGFLDADIKDSVLYVIGKDFPKKIKDKRIKYLGDFSKRDVISVFKSCNYLIHLCHIDSCPNVVVEALSCNMLVLHTNLGGTRELVGQHGVELSADKWAWNFIQSISDDVSRSLVSSGINKIISMKSKNIDVTRLSIKSCADRYVSLMREVV